VTPIDTGAFFPGATTPAEPGGAGQIYTGIRETRQETADGFNGQSRENVRA
jgi:hypothetical protein